MKVRKKATLKDLKDFRAWLNDKSGVYDPGNPTNCLVCQYLKDRNFTYTQFSGPSSVWVHGSAGKYSVVLPDSIATIAYGKNNLDLNSWRDREGPIEFTYQAAAKRADAVIKRLQK